MSETEEQPPIEETTESTNEMASEPANKKQKVPVHAPGMKKVAGIQKKLKAAQDQVANKKAFVAKKTQQSYAKALTNRRSWLTRENMLSPLP